MGHAPEKYDEQLIFFDILEASLNNCEMILGENRN